MQETKIFLSFYFSLLGALTSTGQAHVVLQVIFITNNTGGIFKSVNQKYAFLWVIDIHNEYPSDHFIGSYTEYNQAIGNIINKDIFKYGYPEFFKKVKAAIGE